MSLSSNRFFYTNTNHNDASNVLINFHNLTGNAELNEHPLSKYARGIFFSPNYNKEFFDAINWANNLGDYKTQLNLINPYVNNVLMNIGLLNDNVVLSDQSIISHILQMGSPIDGQGQNDHCGYTVSSNADGTIIAISSHWYSYTDQSNYLRGRVRIYKWNNTSWNNIGTIDGEDKNSNSGYSTSLSDDGTILAIGAPYNDGGGTGYGAGHVRVYDYIEGRSPEWDQLGSDIEGEAAYNLGGGCVSLNSNGTILAIGAKYNDVNTSNTNDNTGHVRVYEYTNNDWQKIGDDIDGQSQGDYFGGSVSLSDNGTIVAIGADRNSGNGTFSGHVRVYKYNGSIWDQMGADIDGEAAGDHSGYSVSLSSDGKIVAIGADRNSGNGNESGHVRVYDYVEGRNPEWKQLGSDIDGEAADDRSGFSVSLSSDGTILAVGAPHNNGPANIDNIGHVRVYQYVSGLYSSDWVQVGYDLYGEAETDKFGYSVSLSKNASTLVVGAYQHDTNVNNAGRVYTYELVKKPIKSIVKMGTIDGTINDHIGYALSCNADGNIIATSSPNMNKIRVYEYINNNWIQMGTDIASSGTIQNGYSISLSADGTIVATGAPATHTVSGHYSTGRVCIYKFSGIDWQQLGNNIDGEQNSPYGDLFGHSVSLSADGTVVAIGAKDNNGNDLLHAGHVRVYKWNDSAWNQLGDDIDGEAASDHSGWSISLSDDGTILAIGAIYNDGNGPNSGHVRVYKWNNSNWDQMGTDIGGEEDGDQSGWSVSLNSDGTIVAIGAKNNDGINGPDSGHVRVYDYVETRNPAWKQVGSDIDGESSSHYGDNSGFSVSLSADGTIVAIGSYLNDVDPATDSNRGSARVYKYIKGLYASDWVQVGYDIDGEVAGDHLGYSVSLSKNGSVLVVGAPYHDTYGTSSGRAYTYKLIEQPSIKSIVKMGKPINGEAASDSFGYAVACNADGTVFAAAAPFNDDGGTNSGHVRVYKYFNPNDAIDNYNDHKYFGVIPTSSSTNTYWATYSLKIIQSGINIVHMDPNNTNELTFEINAHATGYWGFQYGQISVWCNTDTPLWYVKTDATIDGSPLTFELIHNAEYDTPLSGNFVSASSPNGPWVVRNSWLLNPPLTSVSAKTQSGPGYIITSDLNSKWQKLGQDLDGEATQDRSGESSESLSLNADGTIVAIGAILNDGNTNYMHDNRGHVRIYKWNGNIWDRLGDDINGEASNDNSGWSVSLNDDGTIVAIGARYNAGNGSYHSGHVRVYDYDVNRNPQWDQIGSDINGDPDDKCGWSVSLSSDGFKLAVGTANSDGINNLNGNSGHITVYDYVKNRNPEWKRIGDDIYGEGDRDFFGSSVSLNSDGTIVASGANLNGDNGSNSGHVRVFKYNGSTWNKLGSTIVGEGGSDQSGRRISLSADGTILAIGAHDNDGDPGVNSGHVRVYQYIEDKDWVQIGYDVDGEASGYQAGWGLSLSKNGSVLVVGEVYNSANGSSSGRVFTYEIV